MHYLLFCAGLLVMIIAADFLVKSAIRLATLLNISPLVIGLTIVAFGTSAPELFISIQAALNHTPGIALGNVVGSNIANILLVLAATSLVTVSYYDSEETRTSLIFMIAISFIFALLLYDLQLNRLDGSLLLILFAYSSYLAFNKGKKLSDQDVPQGTLTNSPNWKVVLLLMIGITGLPLGGHLTIESAQNIAEEWGISETAIGLTTIAIGTSMPELVTSLIAASKRQTHLAAGNIIGSNIFNILSVMGLTAVIAPFSVPRQIIEEDIWIMLASTCILLPFIFLKIPMEKVAGALMLGSYLLYIATVLI